MQPSSRLVYAGSALLAPGIGIVLAMGIASGAAPGVNSGVRGLVLYGPTCPVQRAGETCERPYQATILFSREPSGKLVAHVRSAANGHFAVRLPAGRYGLEPRGATPYPRAQSQIISVRRHRFTDVTVHFDSGIR